MLSAFILGIALGGLWVRRRIDAAGDTVRLLGWVQVAMGLAALATLPVYVASFQFMQGTMHALARTNGDSVRVGLELAVQAVLLSPNFLYRPEGGNTESISTLTAHELAARVSYFLWSSMPDSELDRLADDGTLAAQLGAQVDRMLRDPKASAFVSQFAGSWLWSRALSDKPLVSDAMKSAQQQGSCSLRIPGGEASGDLARYGISDGRRQRRYQNVPAGDRSRDLPSHQDRGQADTHGSQNEPA